MATLPPRGRRHSDRLVVRESDVSGDCYRDPRIGRVLWTYGPGVQLCDSFCGDAPGDLNRVQAPRDAGARVGLRRPLPLHSGRDPNLLSLERPAAQGAALDWRWLSRRGHGGLLLQDDGRCPGEPSAGHRLEEGRGLAGGADRRRRLLPAARHLPQRSPGCPEATPCGPGSSRAVARSSEARSASPPNSAKGGPAQDAVSDRSAHQPAGHRWRGQGERTGPGEVRGAGGGGHPIRQGARRQADGHRGRPLVA